MIGSLRRELRRLFDSVKVSDEELVTILTNDVMKRDTLDGEQPKATKAAVKKAVTSLGKKAAAKVAVAAT